MFSAPPPAAQTNLKTIPSSTGRSNVNCAKSFSERAQGQGKQIIFTIL